MIKEDEQEGITLIRGHAYHKFLELYKKGVVSNVKSYNNNRLERDNG